MNYQFHENYDLKAFDTFVMNSSMNSLFQCSNWARIKSNWIPYYTCVTDEDKIVATGLVLERKLIGKYKLFYIPRGPILDYKNQELLTFYFDQLKQLAAKRNAIAIRFDPAILSKFYPYKDREENHERMNEDIIERLMTLGAKHKGFTTKIEESTQPRYNAEMDIVDDYESLLEHRTRKCIRQSIHKGIEIKEGKEYVHDLAKVMHDTEVRKKVALRGEDYFNNMMDVYGDHGICMISVLNFPKQIKNLEDSIQEIDTQLNSDGLSKKKKAELTQKKEQDQKELTQLQEDYKKEAKDEVVTSGILACYNEQLMELFYMGNHPDYLRMYGSYLLYKSCLDRCVELQIPKCSFGGIEGTLDDGLTLFKSNWLMNVEEYIGEFNIVLNPIIYNLFDEIYPKLLKLVAKIRGNS